MLFAGRHYQQWQERCFDVDTTGEQMCDCNYVVQSMYWSQLSVVQLLHMVQCHYSGGEKKKVTVQMKHCLPHCSFLTAYGFVHLPPTSYGLQKPLLCILRLFKMEHNLFRTVTCARNDDIIQWAILVINFWHMCILRFKQNRTNLLELTMKSHSFWEWKPFNKK